MCSHRSRPRTRGLVWARKKHHTLLAVCMYLHILILVYCNQGRKTDRKKWAGGRKDNQRIRYQNSVIFSLIVLGLGLYTCLGFIYIWDGVWSSTANIPRSSLRSHFLKTSMRFIEHPVPLVFLHQEAMADKTAINTSEHHAFHLLWLNFLKDYSLTLL